MTGAWPEPYRSPFELRPEEPVDESHLPPWMRHKPGEIERDYHERLSHTCYICGVYIVALEDLDAHEDGHTQREKARASHRPECGTTTGERE